MAACVSAVLALVPIGGPAVAPILAGGYLYVGSTTGALYAVGTTTGAGRPGGMEVAITIVGRRA